MLLFWMWQKVNPCHIICPVCWKIPVKCHMHPINQTQQGQRSGYIEMIHTCVLDIDPVQSQWKTSTGIFYCFSTYSTIMSESEDRKVYSLWPCERKLIGLFSGNGRIKPETSTSLYRVTWRCFVAFRLCRYIIRFT